MPRTRQLEYAAGKVSAIEVNSTSYSRQKPETFAKGAKAVPDGFKFALKASRHAVARKQLAEGEPRHESFRDPAFHALAKAANAAVVFADAEDYPCIDADTADFRYARLQRAAETCATGHDDPALDGWAEAARGWAAKGDAFVFFIAGAKVRNPAAAMALIERLA